LRPLAALSSRMLRAHSDKGFPLSSAALVKVACSGGDIRSGKIIFRATDLGNFGRPAFLFCDIQ